MAKRNAGNDLNRDNWDQEEEPEEVGSFKRATDDEIKRRVIKTARRRNIGTEETTKSIFSGFGGFKSTTATNPTSAFAFLSNKDTNSSTNSLMFKDSNNKPAESVIDSTKDKKSENYYSKLKGLNNSLLKWITDHVNENPICILTPIFEDYKKHLKNIDEDVDNDKKSISTATPVVPPFSTSPPFSDSLGGVQASTPLFSFNSQPNTNSKPFSFANVSAPPKTEDSKTDGDANDEDQPPKVEFTPVVEENSIYSIKCKVFIKKDGAYGDKGVGTLHLKTIENSTNKQIVVRANNNLGNILLNTILMPDVPIERIGKNNVMIFCLPTPESKPPPIGVLLRVTTSEQADELSDLLKKYTKIDK